MCLEVLSKENVRCSSSTLTTKREKSHQPHAITNKEDFVKILFGEIDITHRLITATDQAFAFPSKMPILPGHTLVCPRRIMEKFEELTIEELNALFSLVANVKVALTKEFGATGFNIAWNEGSVAGQTVPHLHIHIVPRGPNDKGIAEYEPRQFLYRPGVRQPSPAEELRDVAEILAHHFP